MSRGKFRTIQEDWELFRKKCIPENASEIQVTECRKAFYGGVGSFMALLDVIALQEENMGTILLESYHQEMKLFVDALPDGRRS